MLVRARATEADLAALAVHYDEPDVRRYLWDDQRVGTDDVTALLAASDASFDASGYGLWCLREAGDAGGRLVGTVALREVEDHPGRVEVMYSLAPSHWGRGLATWAARQAVAHGLDVVGLAEVLGGADAPNVRSTAVLRRIGMTPIGVLRTGGTDVPFYAVDRSTFIR
jgi:RimJ/RimL family protein N-acetyltransferase